MSDPELGILFTEIRVSKDASNIQGRVERKLKERIGTIRNLSKMSEERKIMAVYMVQTILDHLETRLTDRSRSRIDLFSTHEICRNYLKHLTQGFEYLRSCSSLMSCYEDLKDFPLAVKVEMHIFDEIDKVSGGDRHREGQFLPVQGTNSKNHDCSYLVLTVSKLLLRFFWICSIRENGNNNEEVYPDILAVVNEMQPWFRYINQDEMDYYPTIQEWIPTFLRNCTLSMAQQKCSWAPQYCIKTLEQFENASMMDEMHKFGKEILESLFSDFGDNCFSGSCIEVVNSVLNFMGLQCKKNPTSEVTLKLFLKLAVYCTVAFTEATGDECISLASLFSSLTSDYFTEVTLPVNVGLLMEHYAIVVVINHADSYKKWPIPKFAHALSINHILILLEVHLKEFNETYAHTDPNLHPFLCDRISTLILSKYEDCISATEKYKTPIKLPVVEHILGRFIKENLSANCKSESIKHVEQIAKVAVAAFMLLVITKQDTKDYIKKLMEDVKIQPRVLTYFSQRLHNIYRPLYNSSRIAQAIETLQLCCDALWARVSLFCERVKSSEDPVPSNCSLQDSIVEFVEEATNNSASLLRLHQRHHAKDVNSTIQKCIEKWVSAQEIFQILSPSALVHEWVTIQCQKVEGKDPQTCDLAPTIFAMVPFLKHANLPSCIILEEELQCYKKMRNGYPEFCERMEMHIHATISGMNSRQHVLIDRCKGLVQCGMRLGSCGVARQFDCIKYMCEAQTMLFNFDKDDEKIFHRIEYLDLISDICFSVALSRRLTRPHEKEEYIQAVEQGLEFFSKQESKLTERECTLFFYVLDLLSLEGNMELQSRAYRILIKRFGRKLEDLFNFAWKSGNLNHGLCSSPLNEYFIKILPDQSSVSTNVPFWKTCMESESLATSFSIFTTLSSVESDEDISATIARERINEVIKSVSEPKNQFLAARLYFNIAEKMIAKGLIVEALTFSEKGYQLREKQLAECFIIEFEKQDSCEGEANTYACKRFDIRDPSSVSSLRSYIDGTNVYVPTPWNLLKCYLESALQTGILKYMTGSADEALCILGLGFQISSFQGLPAFLVGFSTALGKIWRKKRNWKLAEQELIRAQKFLKDCHLSCCKKCLYILKVKINLEIGDLHLSLMKISDENAGKEYLKEAIELYESAKSMLLESEWKNHLSSPEKKPPKIPVLCNSIAAPESNEDCWHCVPSIVESSESLESMSSLTWECIRRRYLLQVLTKLAKCSKLQGDIQEERRFIMSSMNVVVARNTFYEQHLPSSYVENLLIKNVIADAFRVEHASILYHICCFSLKHKDTSETAILSIEGIVIGLQMALILSRDRSSKTTRKRMLAVLFASFSRDNKYTANGASLTQCAAYYHQLSIGSYFNSCLLSHDQNQKRADGVLKHVLAPHSLEKFEESVLSFFKNLPDVTIVCITMLSYKYEDLLPNSPTSAWLMISRFRVKNGPVVVILPVCKTFTDFNYKRGTSSEDDWTCPWANTVFDKVAPVLRLVIEEVSKDTINCKLPEIDWMMMQKNLNTTLHGFLRDLENSWLGKWKHLLLGEPDDIVGNVEEIENTLESGCYIEGGDNGICEPDLTSTDEGHKNAKEKMCRNPIILVPQPNCHMTPFESLSVLEKQQVYRMPSVGGVLWSISEDKKGINPHDCFYFIPEEEGREELVESFKKWGKKFSFQGKAGCLGTVDSDELIKTLESHDLFVYAGHGSGGKYIPGSEIRKIVESLKGRFAQVVYYFQDLV